jgi:hypothetical protein
MFASQTASLPCNIFPPQNCCCADRAIAGRRSRLTITRGELIRTLNYIRNASTTTRRPRFAYEIGVGDKSSSDTVFSMFKIFTTASEDSE